MLNVYGDTMSGNCYKVKLLLELLNVSYDWVHIDIVKRESRTPDFLAKNPNGRIPVLEINPGVFLPESNAILHYLADSTDYLPQDKLCHARVLQWMFFEQYSHEPFIATSRYWIKFLKQEEQYQEELEKKRGPGYAALDVMEQHLKFEPYFVGRHCTIADIALYAYTHVAHEGGFSLSNYLAIREWLKRVEAQSGYVPMV